MDKILKQTYKNMYETHRDIAYNYVEKDFMNVTEAIYSCVGYLTCLEAIGVITIEEQEILGEELNTYFTFIKISQNGS